MLSSERIAALMELDDDGARFFAELVEMFLSELDAVREALGRAIGEGDTAAIGSAAHRLKGSSGNVGAYVLAAMCAELEAAVMHDEMADALEIVRNIEAHLPLLLDELEPYRSP